MLSVCCLSGGPPGRLTQLLEVLRPVADEIVVAVDDRVDPESLGRVAELADRLAAFPFAEPVERPFGWLHSLCTGDWIFRIDDDEVPSAALLDLLRAPDERLSHVWIPRRWLWGRQGWLTEDPWAPDWQLRLTRPEAARFPGRMHIPVQAEGPHAYVAAPLYHLALGISDFEHRAEKVRRYERVRPGLRIGGLPLNTAYYLPELREFLETDPIPDEDAALVALVRDADPAPSGLPPLIRHATRAEVDAHWAEQPLPGPDYSARIELGAPPSPVTGEVREIDVSVTNLGSVAWPGGRNSLPEIRLSYRWNGLEQLEEQLRTPFPHNVEPGETVLVPMAFRMPDEPGTHELVVDLVHERHRWFGAETTTTVTVRARRNAVVLVGQPPGDEAFDHRVDEILESIDAAFEPILVGPKEDWLRDRFGIEAHSAPPSHADQVLVVPAGSRRDQLRLRREASRLRRASRPDGAGAVGVISTIRHVGQAVISLVLALAFGIEAFK
jgi:hypothetical protein